ncbi:MAG: hypothetical protein JW704_08920, partial [Anaerolineaceae bacterium]|nr:hypothetical protein [Anaerolineaceae bacterium]
PQGVVTVDGITLDDQRNVEFIDGQPFQANTQTPFTLGPGVHCAVFGEIADWLPEENGSGQLEDLLDHKLAFQGTVRICDPDNDLNCDDTNYTLSFSDIYQLRVERTSTNYSIDPIVANIYFAEPIFDSIDDIYGPPPGSDEQEEPFTPPGLIEPILTKMTDFPFEPGIDYWDNHFEIYKILYLTTREGELFTYLPEPGPNDQDFCKDLCQDNFPYTMLFRAYYKFCTPYGHRLVTLPYDPLICNDFMSGYEGETVPCPSCTNCETCPDCDQKYAQHLDDPELFPPGTYLFFPQSSDYWREYRSGIGTSSSGNEHNQLCYSDDYPLDQSTESTLSSCYCYDQDDDKPDPTRLVYLY